jgi:hypothetical protein
MDVFCDKNDQKNINQFVCTVCDFTCCKKGDWNRHVLRPKHINLTNSNASDNKNIYSCDTCDKIYNSRNGLWNHKKKCKEYVKENDAPDKEINEKDLIMMIINDNRELRSLLIEQSKEKDELKTMMLEVIKNGTNNITNSHNTISNNKTFNLQFFLNETCKDAMNIMDFVDSIKLQLSDLENVGKVGYVEGISNIITTNLKAMDVTQRPVHCADQKREVLYIKDDNKWEKEDDDRKKIKKAIKRVVSKNQRLLPQFKEVHPDCNRASSRYSDQYNKIIIESCGGSGDNDTEKEAKIIRNIAKTVTIDKASVI